MTTTLKRKPRILLVSEFSQLNTGYSVYGNELLKGLHKTNKYELAELACYIRQEDPRCYSLPWKVYPNLPPIGNPEKNQEYEVNATAKFGSWKFEETCLDFLPDYVVDYRDDWMYAYEVYSPFREYFYHILMPTVDGYPQDTSWIYNIAQADAILTYTEYGISTLRRQMNDKLLDKKLFGAASPGANFEVLQPIENKIGHKKMLGLSNNEIIVGTVMRNNPRKLFPDLFEAFAKFLQQAPPELTKKVYLYVHTSYPDVGWDIPRLLKESGISHRVYFTYICRNCQFINAMRYSDTHIPCYKCGLTNSLCLPNPQYGVTQETLGHIYNLFDLYVQYSCSEGFGIPIVEAAACGVPLMVTNYSGMEDFVDKLEAIPINVQRLFRDAATHRWLALPDDNDFINKLTEFLLQPHSVRQSIGVKTYQLCKQHYNFENILNKWTAAINSLPIRDINTTWKHKPKFSNINIDNIPNNMNNEDFIRWCLINVVQLPHLLNSHIESKLIRDLNYGVRVSYGNMPYFNDLSEIGLRGKLQPFNRDDCIKELINLASHRNKWEKLRYESTLHRSI